jgi:hypothetical protein
MDIIKKLKPVQQDGPDYCAGVGHRENKINEKLAQGYIIHYGAPNKLLLDMDTPDAWVTFKRSLSAFLNHHRVWTQADTWLSQHGNRHLVITLHDPIESPAERYLLQAALGSDPVRELLSYIDWRRDVTYEPSCLFQPGTSPVEKYELF